MTVKELMDQHGKVMRAKADCDDINFLYQGDDPSSISLRESFFEGAYKRYLDEVKVMKELMAKAEPEVLAEAKRIARENRPVEKQEDE